MSVALNNLNFMISLTDRVSGPMGRVMKAVDQASAGFQKGFTQIGVGAAGLVGAAYSMDKLLEPTKDMQRALGEVKSLGVADATLSKLRDTALKFSTQYGESAADFVRSSYDIQGAISSLTGDELSAFTNVSALLAKGTKANVADITNYVGTMYGIFQKNADAMGKSAWIEQMAAQSAMAINIFKSDGKKMSDSFTTLGASATVAGIAMAEQFGVLGQLQASMPGSDAATKYTAFLAGVGKAQKKLDLKFTDSSGHMLPIVDILDRINHKYKDLGKTATTDLLSNAFGSQDATKLITLLAPKVNEIRKNIDAIGKENGLENLGKMADSMTDPWAKMKAGVDAISVTIGTEFLPVIMPAIESINKAFTSSIAWLHANTEIAKYIGIATGIIFGSIGAIALFGIATGYATVMTTGWKTATDLIFKPLWNMAKAVWGAIPAIWSFTTALLANPITWWVLGIAALAAGVVAAIIYWKEWTAVVIDFGGRFLEMLGVFALVDQAIASWEGLKAWWAGFKAWLSSLNPFDAIIAGINKAISLANALPGVNLSPISTAPVSTGPQASLKGGGILKQMSSVMNANKSTTVGNVTVNNYGSPMSGAKLRDELLFAGG